MLYPREWEMVVSYNKRTEGTLRLRVPGGWLVQEFDNNLCVLAMCPLPDPMHKWELEEEK